MAQPELNPFSSPLNRNRKSAAAISTNPFDLFDFPSSPSSSPALPVTTPHNTTTTLVHFDSNSDPFSTPSSTPSTPSTTFNEYSFHSPLRNPDPPVIPPRSTLRLDRTFQEPHFSHHELPLFYMKELEPQTWLKCTVILDSTTKQFSLRHDASGKLFFTASKRTDGLKAFSLSANFNICAIDVYNQATKIAKLRGNTLGSQYSLFDIGKNPQRTSGMVDVRRELLSVRLFTLNNHDPPGRATHVAIPYPGNVKRPTCKEEELFERLKNRERGIYSLIPTLPETSQLPRLHDFGGLALVHSVKNIMLFDGETQQNVFQLGKISGGGDTKDLVFHLLFSAPFTPLGAFAVAIASVDSKVHYNRQI